MERPRTWSKSILLALIAIYLPVAVPFALGPLTECNHCIEAYLRMAPLVPTIAVGLMLQGSDLLFFLATGATTLAMLVGCIITARRLRTRNLLAINLLLMPLLTLEAIAFTVLLRA